MNIVFKKHFFIRFMISEIPRVSVFGHCPYSVTFPYICTYVYNYFVPWPISTIVSLTRLIVSSSVSSLLQ